MDAHESDRSSCPSRRRFTTCAIAAVTSALAGCSDLGDEVGAPTADPRVDPATWPMSHFDPAGSSGNERAGGPSPGARATLLVDSVASASRVILDAESAYFYQSDGLYAIDRTDGSVRWHVPLESWFLDAPAVLDGTVYAPSAYGTLYAVDAETGVEQWRVRRRESFVRVSPVVTGPVVYVATSAAVYAYATDDGRRFWRYEPDGDAGIPSGLAYADGSLYVTVGDGREGAVHALDARTGNRQWGVDVGAAQAAPVVGEAPASVYVATLEGTLYAIDPASGSVRWRSEASQQPFQRPAVADGVVYAACESDQALQAVDAADGSTRWTASVGRSLTSPAVCDGTVLVGDGVGRVHWLAAGSGEPLGRVDLDKPVDSVAVAGEEAFVVASDPSTSRVITLRAA